MDRHDWNEEFVNAPGYVDVVDRLLAAEVAELEPGTALDLGCGSGQNALALADRGWSVTGIDWADRAVELAQEEARRRGLTARFLVADITTYKPVAQFDLVVSTYALPGGEANRRVLETAAGAVAPGGTLIVAEWHRAMAEVWPMEAADLTTPDEIAAQLGALEIQRAEVERLFVFTDEEDPRAFAGREASVAVVRAHRLRYV